MINFPSEGFLLGLFDNKDEGNAETSGIYQTTERHIAEDLKLLLLSL